MSIRNRIGGWFLTILAFALLTRSAYPDGDRPGWLAFALGAAISLAWVPWPTSGGDS